MIIVPPILKASSITADQTLVNPSAMDLVPITAQDMEAKKAVMAKMEYLRKVEKRSQELEAEYNQRNANEAEHHLPRQSHPKRT